MTDKEKLEKIRSEVIWYIHLRNEGLIIGSCGDFEKLLKFIDSMQEEPVSVWHDASKKSDNPEDVVIINPSDNTGEVLTKCTGVNQGHIWAYTSELLKLDNPCNIGKNLQEPQVKESAEIQHVNDMCKENGNSLTQEPVSEVWHDAQTEQPQAKEKIFATNEYGDCEVDFAINMALYWKKVVKWAYIDDLLNLSNVQRTVKNCKEPVSEDLGEYINELSKQFPEVSFAKLSRIAVRVAKWQKENLWKPADGDDLPIIDREVIAILDYDFGHYKVVYAHRPNPDGWNGTNIDTGEKEHFEPVIYDKGGWNQPHVLYWLDAKLPYEEK